MNVLLKFRHGLGDAVQLTVVLQHLRTLRPDWNVDVQALPGKVSALAGLCRRAFVVDHAQMEHYDRSLDLDWSEPSRSYGSGVPATKAERCLAEVFGLLAQSDLCHYVVEVSPEISDRTEEYLRALAGQRSDGRFRTVLIHYEGNTAVQAKNIGHEDVAAVCHLAKELGYVPVILDWDARSPLPYRVPGVFCPNARHSLWQSTGTGDAATITSLARQSSLCLGIDSGPQKCFGASGTATLAVWRGHHPIHYFGPNPNAFHLVPCDHEQLLRGDEGSRADCLRTFEGQYRFATYSAEDFRKMLLSEAVRLLTIEPGAEGRTLVAYSFCASHRKSQGMMLDPSDHWEMLLKAMQSWNPDGEVPELVSAIGPLRDRVPDRVTERAAIVASPVDAAHQSGALLAIQQAAIYARSHGFGRLVMLADDVLPQLTSAQDLARGLQECDYVGSIWGGPLELNTQVFAARVESLFDGPDFLLRCDSVEILEVQMARAIGDRPKRLDHRPNQEYFHSHRPSEFNEDAALHRTRRFEQLEEVLTRARWVYARIGFDSRPMRFIHDEAGRRIGEGNAGNERVWTLAWSDIARDWELRIAGEYGLICQLIPSGCSSWQGSWRYFERMPIVISIMRDRPERAPGDGLEALYQHLCREPSDINEHLHTLRRLAAECDRVIELGTREGRSTCALLAAQPDELLSVDIDDCRNERLLALAGHSRLKFTRGDSREIALTRTDMLYIDTWHTYPQLSAELKRHAGQVTRIIALHDTQTFGLTGEDGNSPGLAAAIDEFLAANPQWYVAECHRNNNGLAVLRQSLTSPA